MSLRSGWHIYAGELIGGITFADEAVGLAEQDCEFTTAESAAVYTGEVGLPDEGN